jgi:hypothetical protein
VNDGLGGDAYRPTMNATMYANALAISRIAQLVGDTSTQQDFAARAASLRAKFHTELWNPGKQLFMDRFTARYPTLEYQFIDSRELAGIVPWNYGIVEDSATYAAAWQWVMDSNVFNGPHAMHRRTVVALLFQPRAHRTGQPILHLQRAELALLHLDGPQRSGQPPRSLLQSHNDARRLRGAITAIHAQPVQERRSLHRRGFPSGQWFLAC